MQQPQVTMKEPSRWTSVLKDDLPACRDNMASTHISLRNKAFLLNGGNKRVAGVEKVSFYLCLHVRCQKIT